MFSFKPQHDIKRIVACVDGTWYNADGKEGKGTGNVSNTFRVFASVKQGTFEQGGQRIKQVAKYFHGIGVKTNAYGKYSDGYTGDGCKEVIREVYQYCCSEVTSPNDELWLFGFSRGAYVVRAVAALFRGMATLDKQSTGQFNKDYKEGLEFLNAKQKRQMTARKGELYNFLLEKTREGPVIQFLGLFDTVKQTTGDVDFDLSYSRSTRRVRQALAMNEDRTAFFPEIFKTDPTPGWEPDSIIQAWFMGYHIDIGGGAKDDGLSLYPLQWMLVECQKYNLVLEHQPAQWILDKVAIEHPPSLVLPSVVSESGSILSLTPSRSNSLGRGNAGSVRSNDSSDQEDGFQKWKFEYASGMAVDLYDLRSSHRHGDLQKWAGKKLKKKSQDERATHRVKLNPPEGILMSSLQRRPRPVFNANGVVGYNSKEPYGTIIHPSVYFLQDTYPNLGIKDALQKVEASLDKFRDELKSTEHGDFFPWILSRTLKTRYEQVRILICGRSGVGKSTLLNRIFGVDLTDVSEDVRGIHDIDQGFESDQYPGVVIHDSEGFEAGDTRRIKAFEEFLKKRSPFRSRDQQLHAVWICNEMGTRRPIETSLVLVLDALVQYAPDLPVFLIGTKKDEFLRLETDFSKAQIHALEVGDAPDEDCKISIAREQEKRDMWQKRLQMDCVKASQQLSIQLAFVSKDDRESVKSLMHITIEMLLSEVRSGMVAAQVVDTDLKVNLAIDETVQLLRTAVTASSWGASFVLANPVSTPTYSRLLCSTIVRSFGLAGASGERAREEEVDYIMSSIVWSNLAVFMSQSVFMAIGNVAFVVTSPIFQAPLVTRMVLKCACDLMIILDRASQVGGKHVTRQQIEQASMEYQQPIGKSNLDVAHASANLSLKKLVHRRINTLIPLVSALVVKIYKKEQIESIRQGIRDIVETHRIREVTDKSPRPSFDVDLRKPQSADTQSLADTLLGTEEDEEDLKKLAELRM